MDVSLMNKCKEGLSYHTLVLLFFFIPAHFLNAQTFKKSSYGAEVISSMNSFKTTIINDSNKQMVELKTKIPSIVYDLRYAGTNNFVKQAMYPINTSCTFLRLPAAIALRNVQTELNTQGLGLKIFDAYRPYAVTVKFWELIRDERYVANPAKGSGHNRGLAVDLTIIELSSGKELDMGTGFDDFTDTAHHSFINLSPAILGNRTFLKNIMLKHGFQLFETEWWHYYWPNNRSYEVLDIDFRKLYRIIK